MTRFSGDISAAVDHPAGRQPFSTTAGNLLAQNGGALFGRVFEVLQSQVVLIETLKNIMARCRLKMVVLRANISGAQRAVQTYAALQGVPVLELSHGHRARRLDRSDIDQEVRCAYAAYGERDRSLLLELGQPEAQIHVVGAPGWDPLYRPEVKMSAPAAREKIGLDPDRPMVLYASVYPEGNSALFPYLSRLIHDKHRAVIGAMRTLGPEVQFVVRPHPGEFRREPAKPPTGEAVAAYRRWLQDQGVSPVHIDGVSPETTLDKADLLNAADAVIVANPGSSLVTEVMIMRRPAVLLRRKEAPPYAFYTEEDGVVLVEEAEGLAAELKGLLEDAGRREEVVQRQWAALPRLNHRNDGRASERAARLICAMAAGEVPQGIAA